jgi:acyl-CoA synthetase (AMP-forming)/AMP-acid ligase II
MSSPSPHLSIDDLGALARRRGAAEIWADDRKVHTWGEFLSCFEFARSQCAERGVGRGEIVVTPADGTVGSIAWLFGAAACGAVVAPLRPERWPEAEHWRRWLRIGWRVNQERLERVDGGTMSPPALELLRELGLRANPGLILATGGTTGVPKLVLHDLAALLATVPLRSGERHRVLSLMKLDHIGGLDVVLRSLAGGHLIVATPSRINAETVARAVARHRVQVMPATPTILNLLLVSGAGRTYDLGSLRSVPYGAEPMPPSLLSRLRSAFPNVAFVERYGTSETGSLPTRGDRLELPPGRKGFEWKIVDGELWVRSPARALGYLTGESGGFAAEGWFRTGDLAEESSSGSICVRGRRQDLINMGGEKFLPGEVENLLLQHPLVEDCRAFAVQNALVGEAVGAEIVWRGEDRDPLEVKRALRDHFPDEAVRRRLPAFVTLVDAVAATGNQKKGRLVAP